MTAGIVGVFTNPEYRGKGVAKLAMTELKRHLPTEKSPLTTFIKKYKKPYDRWNIEIRHEKRITGLVKNVFDDLNVWDEPIYEIVTL